MVNKRKQGLTQARAKLTSHRMRSATVGTHVPRRSSRHMNGEAVGFSSPRKRKRAARGIGNYSARHIVAKLVCTPVASAVANSPRTSNVRRASAASSRSRSACSWRLPSPPPSAWRRSSGRSMRSSGSRIPMQRRRSLLPRPMRRRSTRWCRPTSMRRARRRDDWRLIGAGARRRGDPRRHRRLDSPPCWVPAEGRQEAPAA